MIFFCRFILYGSLSEQLLKKCLSSWLGDVATAVSIRIFCDSDTWILVISSIDCMHGYCLDSYSSQLLSYCVSQTAELLGAFCLLANLYACVYTLHAYIHYKRRADWLSTVVSADKMLPFFPRAGDSWRLVFSSFLLPTPIHPSIHLSIYPPVYPIDLVVVVVVVVVVVRSLRSGRSD